MVHQDSLPKPFKLSQSWPYLLFFLSVLAFMAGWTWFQGKAPLLSWKTVEMSPIMYSQGSNSMVLARELYTHYFLSFQAAGLVLLVAIVAAVSLVFRGAVKVKSQVISEQIARQKEDCIELVNITSETIKNEVDV